MHIILPNTIIYVDLRTYKAIQVDTLHTNIRYIFLDFSTYIIFYINIKYEL